MADTTMTVTLDEAIAQAYTAAAPAEQEKRQRLFRLILRENSLPLRQLMDTISAEAAQRGSMPEMLEQLLHNHD